MRKELHQLRRWTRRNRRNLAIALLTFGFTVFTLLSLQWIAGVRFEAPRGGPTSMGGVDLAGGEVTPEERDYFSRASAPEQAKLLRERQEKVLTQGANCSGKPC